MRNCILVDGARLILFDFPESLDFSFCALKSVSTHVKSTMNAAKRRRDGSVAATPTISQSNDAGRSSLVQSSPLSQFQRSKHPPQQRPTKSVKLHLPKNNPRASALSPHPRPAYRHSSTSSVAASTFNVARENKIEGQEEDTDPDEIIMCVDMRDRGTVGCCYYESSTGSLHLVEDIKYGGLEVVDTCENSPAVCLSTD